MQEAVDKDRDKWCGYFLNSRLTPTKLSDRDKQCRHLKELTCNAGNHHQRPLYDIKVLIHRWLNKFCNINPVTPEIYR